MKKTIKKRILIAVSALLIFTIVFPYIKVEYQTIVHRDEFVQNYAELGMFEDIAYFKVIEYANNHAEILYVLPDKAAAVLAVFGLSNDDWCLLSWNTVWSRSGSANKFIWPYYW